MIFRITKIAIFLWALPRFDVFIFGTFTTFFGFKELPLLKRLNKKIVYVFLGTDVRPSYLSGNEIIRLRQRLGDGYLTALRDATREKKRKLGIVERYADHVISYPSYAQLQSRDFISHAVTGFPMEARAGESENASLGCDGVRILHAPGFPEAKGSAAIREMVERIAARIPGVEYREVSGVPNKVVLEEIQRSDLVVDEVYSDAPMGGLAAEAAFFRKPAVVGGYYASSFRRDIPPDDVPPSTYCLPEEMEATLAALVADAPRRAELGRRAQEFIRERWNTADVAGRYLAMIEGEFPSDGKFHTADIDYYLGYGISKENLRALLSEYIRTFGREALCMSHNLELERKILEFAGAR
jgi:hypothetical protein